MTDPAADTCWICRARPAAVQVLSFPTSLCADCASATLRYDKAWASLSKYLRAGWTDIVRRGSFDLSKAFDGASAGAIDTHLYFTKLLGCKLHADHINVQLASFAAALTQRIAHPEVTLLIANSKTGHGQLLYYESDVSLLKRDDEVYSAVWMYLAFPVAVKVCYLKSSAPAAEPEGFPWHPTRQRKIVKLSPYKGDTQPVHARRDLRL